MQRPEVLPAPTGMDAQLHRIAAAAADAKSRPESDWHISARLLFPAPGKDIGITGQTDEVKAMLHGCIDIIKLSLFFEDAYPTILSRAGFARTYLLMAAQSHAARHIKHRLLKDESFAARLAAIVCVFHTVFGILLMRCSPWIVSTSCVGTSPRLLLKTSLGSSALP